MTIGEKTQQTLIQGTGIPRSADREAAIRGFGLPLDDGLTLERRLGGATFAVGRSGAARFAAGQGRRGAGVPGIERQ